jgi:hypothetical protein
MDVSGLQFPHPSLFHRLMVVEVAEFTRLEGLPSNVGSIQAQACRTKSSPKSFASHRAASTRPIARSPTLPYAPTASARLIIIPKLVGVPVPTTPTD